MYAITAATGRLGRLVVAALLKNQVPPKQIVAAVRSPDKAAELAAQGVVVRKADYDQPDTLRTALSGVEKLLLISGNDLGRRVQQHRSVLEAARLAGVRVVAYTSVLHADSSVLSVADTHRRTEADLREAGLAHVLLRNGWYFENYTASVPAVLASGELVGCSQDGRISAAARADYADAAVAALTAADDRRERIYELAGDSAFTRSEFAAELSRQSGKTIPYRNLAEADYRAALAASGLPDFVAELLAKFDTAAARGALVDNGRQLSGLIGRPTTTLSQAIAAALRG